MLIPTTLQKFLNAFAKGNPKCSDYGRFFLSYEKLIDKNFDFDDKYIHKVTENEYGTLTE